VSIFTINKNLGTSKFVTDKMKKLQPSCFDTFQKMYKAGINIAMGTDMGFDPEMGTNASEMGIYVKLGMTPMDAILTATRNAAKALKMDEGGRRRPACRYSHSVGEQAHPGGDEGRRGL
jgi:imidazolonepropionase-like amidohydrolase